MNMTTTYRAPEKLFEYTNNCSLCAVCTAYDSGRGGGASGCGAKMMLRGGVV